jgi:cobalt-zinc-cadmium efflux system outer membrane protein
LSTAQIISSNASAALAFRDEGAATDILASLRSDPLIVSAALYDLQERRFVSYGEAPLETPSLENSDAAYATLVARLTTTPAQARFTALARWREAQERLARRESARGDVRWSAGLRRVEATDNFGFVVGLGYALPHRAAGDASAAEARAERDRTVADGEAALHAVRATLFSLYQELGHARLAHETARDELIPAATAWLAAIDAGLAAGRYHARDQLEARTALLSARRRQIAAAADYHATLVELEHLLAAPASP